MLKLVTFPPAFGLPCASPFGVKAICLLNLSGKPWERGGKPDPRKAPKGKLPMLIDGDHIIPDTEDIRSYIEQKYDVDSDKGLSNEQRAISRALIRMLDEHLYFILVCDRWLDDANWVHVRDAFFGLIPKLVRKPITSRIRKTVRNAMNAQGIGRHTPEERLARADKDIKAITTLLGDKAFLFGEHPTAADASAVAMLGAIAASPTETALCKRVRQDTPLMAYLERAGQAMFG